MTLINYNKLGLLIMFFTGIVLSGQTFTRITDAANPIAATTFPSDYTGAAWVDYDNDGDLDLFSTPDYLFRNDGNENFVSIDTEIGSNQSNQLGSGVSWADFDNDGYIDCAIAGFPVTIYRNKGDGTFELVNAKDLRPDRDYRGWACAWADYNKDNYVDLVVAHPAGFLGNTTPSLLFDNSGASALTKNTQFEFTLENAPYTVPTWSDFDLDDDLDLFIGSGPAAGSPARDYLYTNSLSQTGTASLERINNLQMGTDLQDGQVWNWIDYDNDGDLDAYLTNYGSAPNRFYINNNGVYESVENELVFNGAYLANTWGDVDNDGDLDVFITGDTDNRFYLNNGDGSFTSVAGIITSVPSSVGATLGDYDNDGDLDVFISGQVSGLYRNDTDNNNNWINISLSGSVSNRSAIGAKVRAKANINGNDIWLIREVSAQNSFNSHNSLRVHFGFGQTSIIDSLVVYWPAGDITVLENINTNQFLEITEELPGDFLRANFEADSTVIINNDKLNVRFTNKSLTGSGNQITSWQWDFNDDGIVDSEEENPQIFFEGKGNYTVSLTVSDGANNHSLRVEEYIHILGFLPIIEVQTTPVTLGNINADQTAIEDSFYVFNVGRGDDSIFVSIDYGNITNDSSVVIFPQSFEIQPNDSQLVILTVIPSLVEPQNTIVRAKVRIDSKFSLAGAVFFKSYQFRVRSVTSVEKNNQIPEHFDLSQNYPNPFNPSTTIKFQIIENAFTTLKVYDMLGREVSVLINGDLQSGTYEVHFSTDELASTLASGTYFYRLQSGNNVQTKKFVLLK